MRTPAPLPTGAPARFLVSDAAERGISAKRLRAGDLEVPYRGVRIAGEIPVFFTEPYDGRRNELAVAAWKYAPRLKPWQFYSHATSLALQGAPRPEPASSVELHVSAHRPRREPRIGGVIGHRLQVRELAWVTTPAGFRVEDAVRAWRQTGTLWALDDLIAAADFLVLPKNRLATIGELEAEVELMGDVTDGRLTRALREVRIGSESAGETRSRLLITRAGLPEPVLQYRLLDARGRFVARLDAAYPEYGLAFEYDGRHHADPSQFAKDADRWEAIRQTGWRHIRLLDHHVRGPRPAAVRMVRDALRECGWPG
ncbi:endonuclease domain-containing protein [Microbacterium rhizophilus]|uniref:endonuclease domain-containing protein n=1 Tax=Microbacterium rhizophilus TaxID=3138934 RepID=UPI0031F04E94